MAEQNSEEITRLMKMQQGLESEYAHLVTQRGNLKGISNKHKLHETKEKIKVKLRTLL